MLRSEPGGTERVKCTGDEFQGCERSKPQPHGNFIKCYCYEDICDLWKISWSVSGIDFNDYSPGGGESHEVGLRAIRQSTTFGWNAITITYKCTMSVLASDVIGVVQEP